MKSTPLRARRKFDETFKREAVQSWLTSGKSAAVVAEELGLTANLLYAGKAAWPPTTRGRSPHREIQSCVEPQQSTEPGTLSLDHFCHHHHFVRFSVPSAAVKSIM